MITDFAKELGLRITNLLSVLEISAGYGRLLGSRQENEAVDSRSLISHKLRIRGLFRRLIMGLTSVLSITVEYGRLRKMRGEATKRKTFTY